MNSLPPSGWYPDPAGSSAERFWDGQSWSQATRPRTEPQPDHSRGVAQPGHHPGTYGGHAGHQPASGQQMPVGPHGHRPAMHIAGWWWRVLAYIIDVVLLFIPVSLLQAPVTAPAAAAYQRWVNDIISGRSTSLPQEFVTAMLLASLISTVAWILYRTVMVGWKGASAGQLILGLRVVRDGDQDLGVPPWKTAVTRAVVAMVLFSLPLVGLVNMLWPLFNDKRQALHDLAARTVVLKKY